MLLRLLQPALAATGTAARPSRVVLLSSVTHRAGGATADFELAYNDAEHSLYGEPTPTPVTSGGGHLHSPATHHTRAHHQCSHCLSFLLSFLLSPAPKALRRSVGLSVPCSINIALVSHHAVGIQP